MPLETEGWTEFVQRFGDLPAGAKTSTPILFGQHYLVLTGWYDEDTGTLYARVEHDAGDGLVTRLTEQEHATLTRDDYAFDDVRAALAETLAAGVRAYIQKEAAP